MTKIALITGVTGQDGSYLEEFLLENGYEVHGVLMRWDSHEQWERWIETNSGYQPEVVEVFPYDTTSPSYIAAAHGGSSELRESIDAKVFVLKEWDEEWPSPQ